MRKFGVELSPDVRSIREYSKDLTTEERAAIVAARMAGVSRKTLAASFDCAPETISRTVKRFQDHNTLDSLPGRGRKMKLTDATARYMRQVAKRNPRMSWAALLGACPVGVSRHTLRKVLGKHFSRKFRSIKQIVLNEEGAAN